MRVALDATPLTLTSGGLKRYTEQLGLALAAEYAHDVFTYLGDRSFSSPITPLNNLRQGPLPRTKLECRWWLCGASIAVRRVHAQIFHGTNFEVPYLNLRPSVMTLHDLSPWRNPEWHGDCERVRRRTPWLLRLGIATMTITPSEAIRREAIRFFGIAAERIVAVPLAAVAVEPDRATGVARTRFFLYAGTLEPRKNVEQLLVAWRTVRVRHSVDLVLAGRRREDGPAFDEEPGLHTLGEVSDGVLFALYRDAVALVYPSLYEGFGLPVLEAMHCGACVISSNDPALLETGGDAAMRFDSTETLIEAMDAVLLRPDLLASHQEKSRRRAAEFSWGRVARETRAVYEEALARFG